MEGAFLNLVLGEDISFRGMLVFGNIKIYMKITYLLFINSISPKGEFFLFS